MKNSIFIYSTHDFRILHEILMKNIPIKKNKHEIPTESDIATYGPRLEWEKFFKRRFYHEDRP